MTTEYSQSSARCFDFYISRASLSANQATANHGKYGHSCDRTAAAEQSVKTAAGTTRCFSFCCVVFICVIYASLAPALLSPSTVINRGSKCTARGLQLRKYAKKSQRMSSRPLNYVSVRGANGLTLPPEGRGGARLSTSERKTILEI